MACDIIIAVWNKKELTKDCVESIARNTHYPYRLIVVDNGSGQPAKEYLEGLKNDRRFEAILIRNEENLGNTKAVNQGLAASSAEYVCNLDNDIIVTDGWLEELIRVAESDKAIGLVVPANNSGYPPKSTSISDIEARGSELKKFKDKYMELGAAVAFACLIKREVIEKIGLWDETFSPGYFDDTEYSLRATNAGYKPVSAKGSYVYHHEHASFKDKNLEKLFKKSQKLFYEKCGKPKRVLYIIDTFRKELYAHIRKDSYALARKANWVWIFSMNALPEIGLPEHGNIRIFKYPAAFFNIRSLARVLTRKKKFDSIYVTNPKMKGLLSIFKFIHRAKPEDLS